MMVEELKWFRRGIALTSGTPGTAFRCFVTRLCVVVALIAGNLMANPAAGAGKLDTPGQGRVLRMPDTWDVTANENSIYFDQGSSSIEADAAELLRRHAATLRAMPELQITLIAHTTELGSSSLELARGQDRLEAVRKRLEDLKVPPGRIRTENHGSERRNVEACDDDHCLHRNRRVDILMHR